MTRKELTVTISIGVFIVGLTLIFALTGGWFDPKKEVDTQKATIAVVGGQPQGGVKKITAKHGKTLDLTITSDKPIPIHLHGYDIPLDAAPGKPAHYIVPLKLDGGFSIEVEDTSTPIGRLIVTPRG